MTISGNFLVLCTISFNNTTLTFAGKNYIKEVMLLQGHSQVLCYLNKAFAGYIQKQLWEDRLLDMQIKLKFWKK